ncbi:prepilin-type N-terminal cleavage/methylation domain-containing protein [Patescibacteria group bacterium]|nr:prepilin-type N-terminal cleavage/methylation domain-containing protein [Patescibacteria group bacterium]
MKLRKLDKNNRGLTLLETIVAVGLIVVGLVAALSLITTSLFYVSNIYDRLVAANLTAEGIEVVRNIRDNNWLQNRGWNSGLADGDYQVAYNLMALSSYNGFPLLLEFNGPYNYISGTITPYVRKISITNISANEIKVVSMVTWKRRGVTYSSAAEDRLFNWK